MALCCKKMASDPRDDYADSLLGFWEELMKGKILVANSLGEMKEAIVPIEVRLRASELLAKYTVPTKAKAAEDREITVTPDILRVAHMLESDERYTNEDLLRAIQSIPAGDS